MLRKDKFIAVKIGQTRERPAWFFKTMAKVRCLSCEVEFQIAHHPFCQNKKLAQEQAQKLKEHLAWEHKQGLEHLDAISLPQLGKKHFERH